jgi:hypothetical protein
MLHRVSELVGLFQIVQVTENGYEIWYAGCVESLDDRFTENSSKRISKVQQVIWFEGDGQPAGDCTYLHGNGTGFFIHKEMTSADFISDRCHWCHTVLMCMRQLRIKVMLRRRDFTRN